MADKKIKKPSIIKDALSLTIITIICSFALAFVYELTKDPIKAQEDAKKNEAYEVVYEVADSLSTDEELLQVAKDMDLSSLDAKYAGITIDDVIQAKDASGNVLGYIIKSNTRGYSSNISVAIGYSMDGVVQGIELLAINDTPGFGLELKNSEFIDRFKDVATDQFKLTKGSASEPNEIDVYSGATITTEAVVNAVNAGLTFLTENVAKLGGVAVE
ncbi:MAG: FMN-binding protein [Clostridiales bacterium]|nr:FMN-binding protein [Clostridiales bacterium]